jgi:intein/homing endonuclease
MPRVGVVLPSLGRPFAYFLGFLLGDGFASENYNHLVYLVGHLTDERDYYDRVIVPLIKELFNIEPRAFVKKGQDAYAVCFGSVQVIAYLKKIGFPLIAFQKFIPNPILGSSPEIIRAFVQGLFDADGCLVFSKKNYKTYRYPTVEIKSVHKEVADCVVTMLKDLGFRASVRKSAESWVANVNGNEQLEKWMADIGSRNIKHLSKFLLYRRIGSCPPHETTPERLQKMGLGLENFYLALSRETGINVLSF